MTDPNEEAQPEFAVDADLEKSEALDSDEFDADELEPDPLDAGILPSDRWSRGERYGNTVEEQREGETHDELLAEEQPEPGSEAAPTGEVDDPEPVDDRWEGGPGPRSGRLLAGDEGTHPVDDPEQLAWDEGVDAGAAGAEEAAVHVLKDEDEKPPRTTDIRDWEEAEGLSDDADLDR
ncbi:DUF5709 domain-containing protein [Streptomyces sulphureus]|uniref:DUF5709 domain-containing protein n=1 Tax=Streptomyces sulphureus TaxID=47758 RepID=UPI00036A22DE|nr:DUF5709 domain-containing protein [Streptomyces sulphureus]